MRKIIILSILTSALVAGSVAFAIQKIPKESIQIFAPEPTPIPTPLTRYEIETLAQKTPKNGNIEIRETISEEEKYTSYLFEHVFDPTLETGELKTVTGQINIPKTEGKFPLILMIRGYVDQDLYETGMGTKNAAAFFAESGFITLAPDFLGYAGSSSESGDIFETRFQTYTTVLSLLASLDTVENWDQKNIFIWAHSNGGQVALTTLVITQGDFPTSLWAPVTKPFPYSILYYTDESEDGGKFIRKELSEFEELYDTDKFTYTKYLDRIKTSVQLHQGTADDAIPVEWSEKIVATLRNLDLDVTYFKYSGADHNLRPDWDTAVARDLEFFSSRLKN